MSTNDSVVWMVCPYPDEICAEPATWQFVSIVDGAVEGTAICTAGHRWRIVKVPDQDAQP